MTTNADFVYQMSVINVIISPNTCVFQPKSLCCQSSHDKLSVISLKAQGEQLVPYLTFQ